MNHLLAVLVAVALAIGAAPVGAVEVPIGGNATDDAPASTPTPTPEPQAREWVDNLTAIESARYDAERGVMVLKMHSTITQRVTLTDAGAVFDGGQVPRRSARLGEGLNRVEMPVTEIQNRVVVTISTRNVLYAKVIETGSPIIAGPYDLGDVQNAGLAGLSAGLSVTVLIAIRRIRGVGDGPERIL